MKIIIAPDKFKGSLTASQAAAAMTRGVRRVFPRAKILEVPVADGGEGTTDALVRATNGHFIRRKVLGPLGKPVMARFGILGGKPQTAVIEMAEASGFKLVPPEKRNPLITTTYGTGQLIAHAMKLGCKKIIIGIGGSATNDGGAGMAQAFGWKLLDSRGGEIGCGGGALKHLTRIESPGNVVAGFSLRAPNADTKRRLKSAATVAQILVACDVTNPLYGKNGAAYIYAPQKGATPAMVEELDRNLRHFASIVRLYLGKDVAHFPGAGAAGGLGAGLKAFLDAELRSGVELVLETIHFDKLLDGADLVLTGEGKIDSQTANGKTPWGVAAFARRRKISVIAFGGKVPAQPSAKLRAQFDAIVPITRARMALEDSMKTAPVLLESATAEALKNWIA